MARSLWFVQMWKFVKSAVLSIPPVLAVTQHIFLYTNVEHDSSCSSSSTSFALMDHIMLSLQRENRPRPWKWTLTCFHLNNLWSFIIRASLCVCVCVCPCACVCLCVHAWHYEALWQFILAIVIWTQEMERGRTDRKEEERKWEIDGELTGKRTNGEWGRRCSALNSLQGVLYPPGVQFIQHKHAHMAACYQYCFLQW